MAPRNTFFHFLLGTASPESTAEFQRILAGDQKDNLLKKLIKNLDMHEQKQEKFKNNPSFWDKTAEKIAGPRPKSPLDLDPTELERLTKVERDPSEQIAFDLKLDNNAVEHALIPDVVEKQVALLWQANKSFFDSQKQIEYDRETNTLHFEGLKRLAQELMKKLAVKPDVVKDVLRGKYEPKIEKARLSISLPLVELGMDADETNQALAAWLATKNLTGKTAHLNEAKDALLFTGTENLLETLLSTRGLGLNQMQMDRILKRLSEFKIQK
jgi:hypothetical protein